MRRAHAAARAPPKQPLTMIQHEGKPCFTPDDIDKAYDLQLGKMFEGEDGGYIRRLARARVFIEQYDDLCHLATQFNIEHPTRNCIHHTIRSTGSTAASFDHIYPQEVKPTIRAHSEWLSKTYELIETQCRWPINMPPNPCSFPSQAGWKTEQPHGLSAPPDHFHHIHVLG